MRLRSARDGNQGQVRIFREKSDLSPSPRPGPTRGALWVITRRFLDCHPRRKISPREVPASSPDSPAIVLDLAAGCLRVDDRTIELRPKTWDVLCALVEGAGRLVTRTELLDRVWPDTAVAEGILNKSIGELRTALADSRGEPRCIETVSRRGYRWIGNARIVAREDAYAILHDAPLVRVIATGYALSVVLAAAYMAFTIIGAMVLSAARRTRDHAFLRTLGVSSVQRLALTLVEHAPPVLLGLLPGVALGVAIALLVEPGLGLANFTGGLRLPLMIDWAGLGVMIAALVGTVVVAVAGGSWLASRARVADALRIGEH